MVTISKPLSAGQARAYHKEEFTNARENYYTQGDQIHGEWQGQLAERWGLSGEVTAEQFQRLTEGQDPNTGEQLVQHRGSYHYENERGEKVCGSTCPAMINLDVKSRHATAQVRTPRSLPERIGGHVPRGTALTRRGRNCNRTGPQDCEPCRPIFKMRGVRSIEVRRTWSINCEISDR